MRASKAQPRAPARTVEGRQAPDGAEGLEPHVHTMNVIHAARVNMSGGKSKGRPLPCFGNGLETVCSETSRRSPVISVGYGRSRCQIHPLTPPAGGQVPLGKPREIKPLRKVVRDFFVVDKGRWFR